LRPRTDGAAPLVSFFVYRTRRRFLCVTCPCSVLTKCHVIRFVNANNNHQELADATAYAPADAT